MQRMNAGGCWNRILCSDLCGQCDYRRVRLRVESAVCTCHMLRAHFIVADSIWRWLIGHSVGGNPGPFNCAISRRCALKVVNSRETFRALVRRWAAFFPFAAIHAHAGGLGQLAVYRSPTRHELPAECHAALPLFDVLRRSNKGGALVGLRAIFNILSWRWCPGLARRLFVPARVNH